MFSTVYPDMKSDNHNGAVNGEKRVSHIVFHLYLCKQKSVRMRGGGQATH